MQDKIAAKELEKLQDSFRKLKRDYDVWWETAERLYKVNAGPIRVVPSVFSEVEKVFKGIETNARQLGIVDSLFNGTAFEGVRLPTTEPLYSVKAALNGLLFAIRAQYGPDSPQEKKFMRSDWPPTFAARIAAIIEQLAALKTLVDRGDITTDPDAAMRDHLVSLHKDLRKLKDMLADLKPVPAYHKDVASMVTTLFNVINGNKGTYADYEALSESLLRRFAMINIQSLNLPFRDYNNMRSKLIDIRTRIEQIPDFFL